MIRVRVRALAIFVAVIALSGCVFQGAPMAEDTDVPTPQASVEPSLTPTPSPVALVRPSLDDLVLSFEGLGPLRLGDDPNTYDPAISVVEREDDACGEPGWVRWNAAYPDTPLSEKYPGNTTRAFLVGWIRDARVSGIQVLSPRITTPAGTAVGSSIQSLMAAYPDAEQVSTGAGRDIYAVLGSPGILYFTVENDQLDSSIGEIVTMSVQSGPLNTAQPSFHGMGSC